MTDTTAAARDRATFNSMVDGTQQDWDRIATSQAVTSAASRSTGIFQGYYFFHLGLDRNLRDQFDGHPYYDLCAEFCAEYDQPSIDPAYPTMALEEFTLLEIPFEAPKHTIYRVD